MLDAVLTKRNLSVKGRITVKSLVSLALIVCAVVLPQIVHLAVGPQGGVMFLPMYLPVVMAGCLLGAYWGAGIGILSPIVSYLITLAFGNPMPALARLPFMIVELAVFATVSGLFGKKIAKNVWWTFLATALAAISGRAVFIALVAIFQTGNLTVSLVWQQIITGLPGLAIIVLVAPAVTALISFLLSRERK